MPIRPVVFAVLLSLGALSAFAQAPGPSKGPFTAAGTLPGVRLNLLKDGLSPVTSVGSTGIGTDSRLFLTLRDGRIVILNGTVVKAQPFLDLRAQININDEGGLLSLAFHPRYSENGFFFLFYTNKSGDAVVARYKVSATDPDKADPASARTLLSVSQPFGNHNGGQVQFGPDGYLYAAFGDGGLAFDPNCAAQNPAKLLGKMVRIDIDQNVSRAPYYGIPASNPFRGPGNPPDEVWASGFRNPWRFSFDRETGDLWIGDVGQNHREEIDFQPAASQGGENYGWKVMEGTLCSTTNACPSTTPACNATAYTAPVLEYDHGLLCAVTSGVVYRGSRIPELKGAYVFGDFCTGTVWAAFRDGTGLKAYLLADRAPQLTYIGEDAAGELYFAALNGRLYVPTRGTVGGSPDTVGLYNSTTAQFQLKTANTEAATAQTFRFGPLRSTWVPLAGDWNGDGKSTPAFYDPATALFRFKNGLGGGAADIILAVDAPSTNVRPVAGDWDGDGKDTVGLYDVTTGLFHLKNSLTGRGFDLTVPLGTPGQDRIPVTGDWNGDGTDSLGLYDPATSQFLLLGLMAGGPSTIPFGPTGRNALPVTGDWNGDGKDGIGLYDPASALFRLKQLPASGPPDLQFRVGTRNSGEKPIAGVW
jgi:glucose/arabinose dehydrogenase